MNKTARTFLSITVFLVACDRKAKIVSEMVAPEKGDVIEQISILGRIRAERSTLVRSPIDGQLVQLVKNLGSVVKVGDPIVTIEQPKDTSKLAGLIQDEGRLEQNRLQQSQVAAQGDVLKAEVKRMSRLLASGSVSTSEYETAQASYRTKVKELESLRADEKTVQQAINLRRSSQREASKTLYSPISGTVTQLWTEEDNITIGMTIAKDTVVAVIEEPGKYVMKGELTEADYIRVKVGQPLRLTLVSDPKVTWLGRIKSISSTSKQDQFGMARFDVTASFDSGTSPVKVGLEVKGEITLQKKNVGVRLPRSAVKEIKGAYYVSLPTRDGITRQLVTIGLVGDQYLEIVSGLEVGQQVYESYVEASR